MIGPKYFTVAVIILRTCESLCRTSFSTFFNSRRYPEMLIRVLPEVTGSFLIDSTTVCIVARIRDYRIDSQNVLDLSNVLTSDYYYPWLARRRGGKPNLEGESNLGPYILLPKNEDWNLIRWYVRVLVMSGP